jgi:hypothetical protein
MVSVRNVDLNLDLFMMYNTVCGEIELAVLIFCMTWTAICNLFSHVGLSCTQLVAAKNNFGICLVAATCSNKNV